MEEKTLEQKAVHKYLRRAKQVYHGNGQIRKQFIQDLSDALTCYTETHPSCTYEDLVDEFGSPDEIHASFMSMYTNDIKRRNIKVYRLLFIVCLILAAAALIFTVDFIINSYDHSNGYYIEYMEDENDQEPAHQEPAPAGSPSTATTEEPTPYAVYNFD